MDEDFFKDYPVQDEAAKAEADAAAAGNSFVLGGPSEANGHSHVADEGEDVMQAIPMGEGAPPPEDAPPECAAVTEWRVAFAKGLEEKTMEERRVKMERAERARETLRSMQGRWERGAKEGKERNVKDEKEFMMVRDGIIARMSGKGGEPNWDVVPELVDMSGKYKEGARDTSRMRQVLMRMKTN
eukprot:GFKZ01012682.1.p1 GENE.GFKZ01012682.1~~GFKZ01012682.1.p1  ORF type:complete len:185 (-),score=43.51 GFKZ01012682.1:232-786(-)